MRSVFAALAAVLLSFAHVEARSGRILRLEAFKAPGTGKEFVFIWAEGGGHFCITEPLDIRFAVQPDTAPQEFSWRADGRDMTLRLHLKELRGSQKEDDISEFCD